MKAKERGKTEKPTLGERFRRSVFEDKSMLGTIVLCLVIVAGIVAAYFGSVGIAKSRAMGQFEDAVNTVVDQIDSKIERDGEILRASAEMLVQSGVFENVSGDDADTFVKKLQDELVKLDPIRSAMNFRVLLPNDMILLPDGQTTVYVPGDNTATGSTFRFEEEVGHGEHISRRFESVREGSEGTQLIAHFVPIYKNPEGERAEDEQPIAMLYGVTPLSRLPALLRTDNIYNSAASVMIFDVASEGHEAILDTWHGAKKDETGKYVYDENYKLTSFDDFMNPRTDGKSGKVTDEILSLRRGYTKVRSQSRNQTLYFYYAPAGGIVKDSWIICIAVPASIAFGNVRQVRIVFIIVAAVFVVALALYFLWMRKMAKKAIAQSVERAVLEEKLHKAEAAERAKTTFLSNMSHDIRTPMNAILGFTALAETNVDNKERVQDYLKKIMSSGNHLLSLINDILDMSRIESGKLNIEEKPCSISDIFRDMRNIIQTQMRSKQLNFFMDTLDVVDEDIFCDKLHLNQVLLNLLSNAIKFTPAGGSVSLTIRQTAGAPAGYGGYEIRVKDTGIGMSREFAEHIFEPFERERTSTVSGIQGTGLGMAITKNIVDTMGGAIRVETEKGKGTEFILNLQFRLQSERRHVEVIRELEGLRALVVDDSFETCDSVSKMLAQIGMRAEWTMYGKEAVLRAHQARDVGDAFSVYIIDWVMPDLSGFEIVRQVRKVVGDEIPIIVITAYDVSSIMDEAKDLGVTAYCNKPIFLSELRDTLVSVVAHEEKASRSERAEGNGEFSGKRLLLVEDNELNREIAEELLVESGFEVDSAEDGTVALEKMEKAEPGRYDLILMDVQMPVMDGYEATRRIRALPDPAKNSVPIVAMTANAFDEDRQKAAEAGMNAHVAKPINVDRLLEVLRGFLAPPHSGPESGTESPENPPGTETE